MKLERIVLLQCLQIFSVLWLVAHFPLLQSLCVPVMKDLPQPWNQEKMILKKKLLISHSPHQRTKTKWTWDWRKPPAQTCFGAEEAAAGSISVMLRLMLNELALVPEYRKFWSKQSSTWILGTFLCFWLFLAASVTIAGYEPMDPALRHLEYLKVLPWLFELRACKEFTSRKLDYCKGASLESCLIWRMFLGYSSLCCM